MSVVLALLAALLVPLAHPDCTPVLDDGTVSDEWWWSAQLEGWHGHPDDGQEALYPPHC